MPLCPTRTVPRQTREPRRTVTASAVPGSASSCSGVGRTVGCGADGETAAAASGDTAAPGAPDGAGATAATGGRVDCGEAVGSAAAACCGGFVDRWLLPRKRGAVITPTAKPINAITASAPTRAGRRRGADAVLTAARSRARRGVSFSGIGSAGGPPTTMPGDAGGVATRAAAACTGAGAGGATAVAAAGDGATIGGYAPAAGRVPATGGGRLGGMDDTRKGR